MKEIPATPPPPNVPPAQDFTNQVMPHTGSQCPLVTTVNYLVWIAPIVYMAFQAQPISSVEGELDSSMGHGSIQNPGKDGNMP
ncbi:hypothetical protein DSO57_1014531 [Entomophthora muscae]|uniref:Uncharacterized protein n=1 Tax=Entomophthora muscae TaxID=34485 RepID=A0ACC2U3V0_9FUNG|nr:hypothetical protein DSO57_1014531 [Entomophthora muscae]